MKTQLFHILWMCIILAVLFVTNVKGVCADNAAICKEPVQTLQGPVSGASAHEGRACVYKGIPYAAPPVGKLRFRPPLPPQKREKTLHALEFGPECVQPDDFSWIAGGKPNTEPSEDCLYLNIWRPARQGRFPVLVFIHGGRYVSGSGARPAWQGDRLAARQDLVVVTINYRLGPFGFLAHPDLAEEDGNESAGNYGLLDQVRALQWVKNNIHAFGGDSWRVTVAGSGAGGWSVCNLLTSQVGHGLFHRAIMQSGGCRAVRSKNEAFEQGTALAAKLGCTGSEISACLREKSAQAILDVSPEPEELRDWYEFPFMPVKDGYVVRDTPLTLIKQGNYNRVPVIVGSNRNEANFLTFEYPGLRLVFEFTMRSFLKDVLGKDGLYGLGHFYTLSHYRRPADQALDAFGDLVYGCPGLETVDALSAKQKGVYYYSFYYDEHLYPHMLGAAHGFEVPFILDTLDRMPYNLVYASHQRENARPLIDVMAGFWTRLAATGNPNHPSLPQWPAYDSEQCQRMYLDLPAFTIHTDNLEKCGYWNEHQMILNQEKED